MVSVDHLDGHAGPAVRFLQPGAGTANRPTARAAGRVPCALNEVSQAVGCAKLASKSVASLTNVTASAGTPEYGRRKVKARAGCMQVCRLAVFVVKDGKCDPASLAHPTKLVGHSPCRSFKSPPVLRGGAGGCFSSSSTPSFFLPNLIALPHGSESRLHADRSRVSTLVVRILNVEMFKLTVLTEA